MNKRIRELAEQAGFNQMGIYNIIGIEEYHQKFAELIIQECVQTLRDNTPVPDDDVPIEDWDKGYIRAMIDCEHHIKEHFGVE